MSPEDEIEQCIYELRLIAVLERIAEVYEGREPEDILTDLGLEFERG